MAFIKRGDPAPIVNNYDDNCSVLVCERCGNVISGFLIGKGYNKSICESCENNENTQDDEFGEEDD